MDENSTISQRKFFYFRVLAQKLMESGNHSMLTYDNGTDSQLENNLDLDVNTDIYSKVVVTVIYVALFIIGCLGNSITLYTSLMKKSLQNLQSTVHYHLASLAVSDLLILVLCMPIELYNFIWVHHPWAFGEAVCKGYYFLRDGCSYATALNIASLSVERYMAICHPFKAKSIMSRSRTKKLISGMWVASFLLATPMLFTMGQQDAGSEKICTSIVSPVTTKIVLQINAFLSFVVPMAAISVLNGIIASQLLRMFRQAAQDTRVCIIGGNPTMLSISVEPSRAQSLQHGVMVLRAVVLAFVVCWLPYHARRLMFCYVSVWTEYICMLLGNCSVLTAVYCSSLYDFYHYFYMVTNVLFYISSVVNPVLYNLVSDKYREVFFNTFRHIYLPCHRKKQRRVLSRHSNSISSNHTISISTNIIKETVY